MKFTWGVRMDGRRGEGGCLCFQRSHVGKLKVGFN